jgi:hypothetical protein
MEQKIEIKTLIDKNNKTILKIDDKEIHNITDIEIKKDAEQKGLTSLIIKLIVPDTKLSLYQGTSIVKTDTEKLLKEIIKTQDKEKMKYFKNKFIPKLIGIIIGFLIGAVFTKMILLFF